MDRAPEIVRAVQAAQGAAAAAALVQQDPSSQIELELPIDAFAGDADHQKQIHQDFWQGPPPESAFSGAPPRRPPFARRFRHDGPLLHGPPLSVLSDEL